MHKAVLVTSVGDSSGMNVFIRAIERSAIQQNWEELGINIIGE